MLDLLHASEPTGHGYKILAISMATIALGPLLHGVARREQVTLSALDSFVLVAVIGLAVIEIIPGSIALAGWPALIAAVAGLLGPALAEGPLRLASRATHRAVMLLAIVGMIGHAFTDGIALAGAHVGGQGHGIEIAIIAHQLPVAMAVWWLMRPSGALRATLALAAIAVATLAGFGLTSPSMHVLSDSWKGLFQGLVGGLVLHVVSHHAPASARTTARSPRESRRERFASRLGSLAGLGLLSMLLTDAVTHTHHPGASESPSAVMLESLIELTRESAPALLVAFALAGIVGAFLPAASVRWMSRGGAGQRALRGMAFGLPLPLCSCGVVPVYRSLVRRGVPAASGLAFLIATPELGLDAIILSIPLLGGKMTLARVVGAAVVALCVGWLVGGRADREAPERARDDAEVTASDAPTPSVTQRLRDGLRVGLVEMVDSTGPWIAFGLVLGALLSPWVDAESLTAIPDVAQVGLFALLGIPIYVCASGATPLVAILLAKGMSPGAALAFLLTGPATNATTFGILRQLHGRHIAWLFAGGMISLAVTLGYALDLIIAPVVPDLIGGVAGAAPGAHVHGHAEPSLLANLALLGLGGLFMASFLRLGPRGMLKQLRFDNAGHGHDHEDDQDHGCCDTSPTPEPSCCGTPAPAPASDHGCCGHEHGDHEHHDHDHHDHHDHDHGCCH